MKIILSVLVGITLMWMVSCKQNSNTQSGNDQHTNIKKAESASEKEAPTDQTETNNTVETAPVPTSKAGDTEPFNYLKKIDVDPKEGIYIKYNDKMSEVYNKKIKDLPKSDPFYPESGGPSLYNIKLIKTKLEPSGEYYYVVFSYGPSADPAFLFYKEGHFDRPLFSISALQAYVPGNGSIYSSGHTNNMFNTRKKYQLINDDIKEVEQPFYYVGLDTKTSLPVKLYAGVQLNNVIANLPAGYDIEVLINRKGTNLFLVKTKFGLTGWMKAESRGRQTQVDQLYFAGD